MNETASVTDLRVFDVRQAAKYMGLNPRTVLNLLRAGDLVGRRVGKPWKIHADAIRDYLMQPPDRAAAPARRHKAA